MYRAPRPIVSFSNYARIAALALIVPVAACQPTTPGEPEVEREAASSSDAPAAGDSKSPGVLGRWLGGGAEEEETKLEFAEPAPGPRSPTAKAFHVDIGTTSYEDVQRITKQHGFVCEDTSIRAKMKKWREAKMAEAEARGEDAVTSASWTKKSKREKNPQVRYACQKVLSTRIGDRERPMSAGRLLYVFDSETLPARHASYQRIHKNQARALEDLSEVVEHMKSVYGEPTAVREKLPTPAEDGTVEFPLLKNIEFEWRYSDLLVKIHAVRLGGEKITIGERIEVPIGVRPDAPALARSDVRPASAPAENAPS